MEQVEQMNIVQLLHNPTAGDEEHDRDWLIELLRSNGFECRYSSTKKKDWKGFDEDADFIVIAGGDGTIGKISREMLDRKMIDKLWPIAIIPLGTANNIASSLGISQAPELLVAEWKGGKIKKFDVGRISHIEEAHFFLESFGYGLFPYMIQEMKKRNKEKKIEDTSEKIMAALELLLELTISYEPRQCRLQIDGEDYSGNYILAEIMNTKSIGPNLILSPGADPGDGYLDVVLISENEKDKFISYLQQKINGSNLDYDFKVIRSKQLTISWDGTHVHVDDEVLKLKKELEVDIKIKEGLLEFITA